MRKSGMIYIMSFQKLFAGMFIFLAIIGYGLAWLYAEFVLPSAHSQGVYTHTHLQAFVIMSVFLLVIAVLFSVIVRIIARPIRSLTTAMDIFAQKNEQKPVLLTRMTPREIRTLVLTFINLSERVEGAHKRTVENARVKSDFISTAAHQLRTPLTGIRWALEALEQDASLSDEEKTLVKDAEEKSHALVSIVSTLLDISSIESGKYRYTFTSVDIEDLLQKTTQDFQHLAHERTVTLEYKPPAKHLLPVRADKERIQWVLNNVIENAIRYTPSGGHVSVWSEMISKNMVLAHITDTGIGIPSSNRSSIFERFYRAGNAISKENAGNGLGLYIARTIATDHGGDLNFVANDDGVGTTFTLSLPVMG